ncbi:MAG TPA: TMEM175 family protein [Acidimicrobiales bacterium]|nr:TMEM175 family protein [Acidimicrobiales bacterium]
MTITDSTARLEAFSDGVFAIAATLLILDVRVEGHHLANELRTIWPSYAAYAVSFITIGVMWVNHHTVFDQIARCDRRFLMINVFLLMFIAFVPFPTRLIADHLRDDQLRAAALAYGVTLTLTAVFYNLLWFYAAQGRRLLRADADDAVVRGISRSYRPGPWIYLAATLAAIVSPVASVILFAAITVFYVIDSAVFARGSS